jgi:hypothetical protein
MLGKLSDRRIGDAKQRLRELRRPDGTWVATGRRYWRRGNVGSGVEVVTWGDAGEFVTPIAQAILQ